MPSHETLSDESGSTPKRRAARGKWTAAQRREIVDASQVAGAEIGEVAKQYGVRPALISSWRRQLVRNATAKPRGKTAAQFAAVHIDRESATGVIEIDLGSRCIRIRGVVDPMMLREVLAATR
jgi:transposase-like protein